MIYNKLENIVFFNETQPNNKNNQTVPCISITGQHTVYSIIHMVLYTTWQAEK